MTGERWERMKALFDAAIEQSPAERSAFLDAACDGDEPLRAEVNRLLLADDAAAGFLVAPAAQSVQELLRELDGDGIAAGEPLGSYRVVRELGSGGMGTVYLAERDDDAYRKRVAVKVVRGGRIGSSAVQRFREERQILAELEHPNIARLVDGGTSASGVPYLVMEHVDGAPIDAWCDTRLLPVAARLALFGDVCAAVQHAHQRLVVHRDIKASNVLVTADGQAKLLDFGIAKLMAPEAATAALTLTSDRLLTPESASPEQVRGESLTTASDVYQLGVLLYRLLTGRVPYQPASSAPQDLARAICEQEPERASTAVTLGDDAAQRSALRGGLSPAQLRRRLAGDLDVILGKALRKEPERRYITVAAFADDVRRHLGGLPVTARAESLWYRTGKLVTRHKLGVAALAVIFASLVGGLLATSWEARVARAERERAARRFDEVRHLAHDFLFDVHDAIRELPGSMPARALIVREGLAYLDRLAAEAGGDPALARELANAYERLGDIQGGFREAHLGDTRSALTSYRRALTLRETLLRDATAAERPALRHDVASSHARLGALLFSRGDTVAARAHLTAAVTDLETLRREGDRDPQAARLLATADSDLAYLIEAAGDPVTAVAVYRRAEGLLAREPNATDARTVASLVKVRSRLARALAEVPGSADEALRLEQGALAAVETLAAARPGSAERAWMVMMQHAVLGVVAHRLEQPALAGSSYEQAIAAGEKLLAADPENAQWAHDLALCYALAGILTAPRDPAAALGRLSRALQLAQPLAAKDPADIGMASVVVLAEASRGRSPQRPSSARSRRAGSREAMRECSAWRRCKRSAAGSAGSMTPTAPRWSAARPLRHGEGRLRGAKFPALSACFPCRGSVPPPARVPLFRRALRYRWTQSSSAARASTTSRTSTSRSRATAWW